MKSDPWARLVSLYEMIRQRHAESLAGHDFTAWVKTISHTGSGGGGEDWQRWRKYGTCSLDSFAGDEAGRLLVDRVIRLEDIHDELVPYLASLGLSLGESLAIPHVNKGTATRHWSECYTQEARERVARSYRYDLETFRYRFGDP